MSILVANYASEIYEGITVYNNKIVTGDNTVNAPNGVEFTDATTFGPGYKGYMNKCIEIHYIHNGMNKSRFVELNGGILPFDIPGGDKFALRSAQMGCI